ncbi:MAG: pseudaminic acid cytidylyltransferase [Roseibium sp.]|uniref:pseudaminic acid cytidylyltransferase n=1 Tax=Roseibium sp. TaxID=1936156 RepID=UPI003296FB3E
MIPARGASKRIPRKNIRNFCGKPIIAYSIEAAIGSDLFDHVVVSTDDDEIADVARQFGAEVPFSRPANLSDDHAPTIDVIQHSIRYFSDQGITPAYACCIYATAPFVRQSDLRESYALLTANADMNFCFGVTEYPYPIQRALRVSKAGGVNMVQPEFFSARSQDLEKTFHDAGQFYWGRRQAFLNTHTVISPKTIPFVLPIDTVQDIDDINSWRRAEAMFTALSATPCR